RVAPQPGSEGTLFVGGGLDTDNPLVKFRLRGDQALESRAGQFAGIPGVIGSHLRIADIRAYGNSRKDPGHHSKDNHRPRHGRSPLEIRRYCGTELATLPTANSRGKQLSRCKIRTFLASLPTCQHPCPSKLATTLITLVMNRRSTKPPIAMSGSAA